ncbi:hypothetical protein CEXT_756881, partial [Caerostris extrusa]
SAESISPWRELKVPSGENNGILHETFSVYGDVHFKVLRVVYGEVLYGLRYCQEFCHIHNGVSADSEGVVVSFDVIVVHHERACNFIVHFGPVGEDQYPLGDHFCRESMGLRNNSTEEESV